MKDGLKKITILHSNDIHGKFTGKTGEDGKLRGSLAQVGGYVRKAKADNPNTAYCIAGDVFQGSLIDSDFLGLSTMEILNLIDIDVMSIGNHELDYGISHMIFVGRYANFPVINANFLIKSNKKHLFKPYHMVEMDGVNVLFIGLITKNIVDQTKAEGLVGRYVTVDDAEVEIRRTFDRLEGKGRHADIVVLLTHIGWEADLELAKRLSPDLGIDIIVGAHSHTYIEKPEVVNGIVVLQAGMENTHLGRLDIGYDEAAGRIADWEWEMIPVDDDHCPVDKYVRAMINTYVMDIDEKYGAVVTRLLRPLDNYGRGNTTEVGQLFADVFADALDLDVMFLASSSTRCYSLDMTVTLQDLREAYPYDGKVYKLKVTGEMIRHMVHHMLRDEVLDDWVDVFYHTSKNLKIEYDKDKKEAQIWYKGEPLRDDDEITIGLQEFYYLNSEQGLGYTNAQLKAHGGLKLAAADAFEVLRDYLHDHHDLGGHCDDRYIVHGTVRGEHFD
ncbi:MAG: bifunctional metallophosphatase/5'-nucleotidase [Clostridiales bacterium]|jgi:5'-nucleotidase|nr:bifunctional metallophosphatase/5'-nucleotidase [Clostridiales bacterium]